MGSVFQRSIQARPKLRDCELETWRQASLAAIFAYFSECTAMRHWRLRLSLPSLGVSSLDFGPFNLFEWPFFAVKAAVGIDGTLKIMPGVIVTPIPGLLRRRRPRMRLQPFQPI